MNTSSAEHAGKGKEGKGRANTDFVMKTKVQRDNLTLKMEKKYFSVYDRH